MPTIDTSDNDAEGTGWLRSAALLQAAIGLCTTVLGLSGATVVPVDFESFLFLTYSVAGISAISIALPLARRARWAWRASLALVTIHPLLPLLHVTWAYLGGSLHGSECSILLFVAALPASLLLAVLLLRGRSTANLTM